MPRSLLVAVVLIAAPGAAEERERPPESRSFHVPDHVKLQTGGYLGLATVGLGISALGDVLNATGYYGWVPRAVGGRDISSFALVLALRPPAVRQRRVHWIPVYAGLGALYVRGDGFFVLTPDEYPPAYYPPTGIRMLGLLGSELGVHTRSGSGVSSHGAFIELVVLDIYAHHWLENTSTLSPFEIVSTAVGYKLRLP